MDIKKNNLVLWIVQLYNNEGQFGFMKINLVLCLEDQP